MNKEYIWQVHFLKKAPCKGVVIIAFAVFLMLFLGYFENNVFLAVLAFILVFVPNMNFFLPIGYKISEDGITVSNPLKVKIHPWSEFKRYKIIKGAVLLNYPLSNRLIRRNKTIFLFDVPAIEDVEKMIKENIR